MVRIIQFPTDEKIPDKEFQPSDKYGILVVGKNFYTGFVFGAPDFPRWHPIISGNLNIYDWELLMTGTVDFGERSPLNALDDIISFYKENDKVIRISKVVPRESVRATLASELEAYESGKISNGGYKEIVKVWSGTEEVLPEFYAAIKRFADLSNNDTLTTLIIFSHGERGSIQMGNYYLQYSKLLRDLDKIKGKKAVFIYACHSGSFLDVLRIHPHRINYAAITSCEAKNLSTNWDDRKLDDYLFGHFSKGKRFSDLELKSIERASSSLNPQILRYFDVRLIWP